MGVAYECREFELSVCWSQVNVLSSILRLLVMNAYLFSIMISPLDLTLCIATLHLLNLLLRA